MTPKGRTEVGVERFDLEQLGRAPHVTGRHEHRAGESIQASLVRAGQLDPIEEGLAEVDWGWVPRARWQVSTMLEITEEQASAERLVLECDGLETVADVRLGRRRLGRTENGLRPHRFDLTGLRAGEYALGIRFESLFAELERRNGRRALPGWGVGVDKDDTAAWIRTAPVHMGWDFAPKVVPVGVTGPVRLVAFDRARIDGVAVRQEHRRGQVRLEVEVELERASRGAVQVEASLALDGEYVGRATVATGTARGRLSLDVPDPRLWWPNTYGAQPLYTLSIVLRTDEALLDGWQGRIGLRTVELDRRTDRDGERFAFVVNGRRIDARGANWVPTEPVPGLGDDAARTTSLLDQLVAANATMVRVWGGGPPASEHFYDRCDALGLLVWQDFSFACTTYPSFDADWLAEVELEARHHVRRLRHRPSLALWCGNNEVENGLSGPRWTDTRMAWKDYRALFDRLLARVVRKEDGVTAYWPGSPHSPTGDRMDFNSEESGDAHLWTVWHGGADFASFRDSRHRFVSEFGFQSLPSPETLFERLPEGERNLTAPGFEHRQRAGGGNQKLLDYLTREHRLPTDFEHWCWLTQILQAEGIVLGVERWRRNRPRCGGSLIWQWNEPWSAPTWSAIDRDGRPKALYHVLARSWSPRALSVDVDPVKGRVDLWAVNDGAGEACFEVRATPVAPSGEAVGDVIEFEGRVGAGRSKRVGRVELAKLVEAAGRRPADTLLLVESVGAVEAVQLAKLAPWKSIDLAEARVRAEVVERDRDRALVELSADALAPWSFLANAAGAAAGGNFVHLRPGRPQRVLVSGVEESLVPEVRSLVDLR